MLTGYLAIYDLDKSFQEVCKNEEDIQDCITTVKRASMLLLLLILLIVYMQGQCLIVCLILY